MIPTIPYSMKQILTPLSTSSSPELLFKLLVSVSMVSQSNSLVHTDRSFHPGVSPLNTSPDTFRQRRLIGAGDTRVSVRRPHLTSETTSCYGHQFFSIYTSSSLTTVRPGRDHGKEDRQRLRRILF